MTDRDLDFEAEAVLMRLGPSGKDPWTAKLIRNAMERVYEAGKREGRFEERELWACRDKVLGDMGAY